jgi:phosphohistidine phosphatase
VDPQRPLSPVGRQEVETVARMAAARNVQISAICHSGILRAQQTAELLGAYLDPAGGVRRMTGLLPQDDPTIAKAELEASHEPLMLVGHLPHMGHLAALLAHGDPDRETVKFAPATLICCSSEGHLWKIIWVLAP